MHNSKGKLQIFAFNITSYESAIKANLSGKSGIKHLELFWSGTEKDRNANYVLEGVKTHCNLKRLTIVSCQNSSFPSWIEIENFSLQFVNLVEIKLDRLNECEQLPSLRNLPCLQILHIFGLHKVTCIMGSSNILNSNRKAVLLSHP